MSIWKPCCTAWGALTAEAWGAIKHAATARAYGADRAVHLEAGGMLYIDEGILKQYVRTGHTRPSINRFLQKEEVYSFPYDANGIYIKTLTASTLYYWDEFTLRQLIIAHPSLLAIYIKLRDIQAEVADFKLLLLEQSLPNKLLLFNKRYHDIRPFIKNKDLANYLHVNESTLSRGKNQFDNRLRN